MSKYVLTITIEAADVPDAAVALYDAVDAANTTDSKVTNASVSEYSEFYGTEEE